MVDQYTDRFGITYKVPNIENIVSFVGIYDKKSRYKKEIITNKCPNCGAPLKPGETKCSYCDSWFSVIKE